MTNTKSMYLAVLAVLLSPMAANAVPIDGPAHGHGTSGSHDDLLELLSPPHADATHTTWMTSAPPTGSAVTINWFLDSHSGTDALSAGQQARIRDAAAVWNAAGANLVLTEVLSDAAADIHVHGSSTSGCGGGAIGCASFTFFTAHSGAYADSDNHHMMAGNTLSPLSQVLTQITRSDWYSGAAAGGIGAGELDYMTVAIQEFGHLLGLGHNSGIQAHGDSAISPMNGSLSSGVTRRVLQPTDITAIQHIYGAAAVAVPEPGTLALLGIGLAGMGLARRRRKV